MSSRYYRFTAKSATRRHLLPSIPQLIISRPESARRFSNLSQLRTVRILHKNVSFIGGRGITGMSKCLFVRVTLRALRSFRNVQRKPKSWLPGSFSQVKSVTHKQLSGCHLHFSLEDSRLSAYRGHPRNSGQGRVEASDSEEKIIDGEEIK